MGLLTSFSSLYSVLGMLQFSYATLGSFSPTECTVPLLRLMGVMCSCQWESRPLKIFLVDLVETELTFVIAVLGSWSLISGMLMTFSELHYWTRGCGENIKQVIFQSYNFLYCWVNFCLLCPLSHPSTCTQLPGSGGCDAGALQPPLLGLSALSPRCGSPSLGSL